MKRFLSSFQFIKEIYPFYLILLVFIPMAVGFIIDSELIDSRYIIINLIWMPLFTIPFILLRKRIIYLFSSVLFFIIGFVQIVHWVILKGPITITSLLVISNTNIQEALGFFDLKASYWLILLVPYVYIFILSLKTPKLSGFTSAKYYTLGFVLVVSVVFISENAIHGRLIRKGAPQMLKLVYSFIDELSLYREASQETHPRHIEAKAAFKADKQTFVLILGESLSRKHMGLYAYYRNNNPQLSKRNDLVVYQDVVSPYSNTLNSVLTILTESNLEHKISFDKSIDIIDIFHSAGFKTYWLSNQSPIGIWDNMVTVFAKKADDYKFVNISSNSSFEATMLTSYDSKLFRPFANALKEDIDKKLIILHLMGSHSKYSKRYPRDFDVYKGSTDREQTIAEYDNSVLYNDFIVDSLIDILQASDVLNRAMNSLIYLSDHAENVYDEMDRVGHDYSNILPKSNVEIPFVIWLSQAYREMDTTRTNRIVHHRNRPFVSDDLFHCIMDINAIESPYFIKERSVFHADFNDKRVRILEDARDYDKK